jgi:hypothetical protein
MVRILVMLRRCAHSVLCLPALGLAGTSAFAGEGTGTADSVAQAGVEIESEFYAGKGGYLHGGLSVLAPFDQNETIGVNAHVVREHVGEDVFPSMGADFEHDFTNGFGLKAYSFGYFPVDDQHAWAMGMRGSQSLEFHDHVKVSPFFGPVFAQVQAFDESTERPANIDHVMLLGGFSVEAGKFEVTAFGSHSFFSRDPVGLETHVDLQEMTQFEAYDNNDGFARNSGGFELSYSLNDWLTLTARYALIFFDNQTRQAITFVPSVKLNSRWEAFAGVQFLRGGTDQDLVTGGASLSF